MRRAGPGRQQGIAALTAILVVAIATVLAVNLLWTTSVDIERTQALLSQDQARLYDLGGEDLARSILADDFRDGGPGGGHDTNREVWAKVLIRKFNEGTLEGWLVDEQGRFDLNSLVDPKTKKADPEAKAQFERLLSLLPVQEPLDATALAESVIDWIDPDSNVELSGAEDSYYTNLQPPYVPANTWFTSISELQAVKGFTPEIYVQLAPHVTALPPQVDPQAGQSTRWPINVNTATDLVLASLVPGQTAESVTRVCPFEVQPQTGAKVCTEEFDSDAEFRDAFQGATGAAVPPGIPLGISSNWFLLTVTTSIGTTRSTMYSLLERERDVVHTRLRAFDAN